MRFSFTLLNVEFYEVIHILLIEYKKEYIQYNIKNILKQKKNIAHLFEYNNHFSDNFNNEKFM